jgi:hypothetical protein
MRMARKAIVLIFLNKRAHLYFIYDIGWVVDKKRSAEIVEGMGTEYA